MSDRPVRLRVQRDGISQLFDGQRVLVGRNVECDVTVSEPSASRQHAVAQRDGDGWTLVDTSAHGTWVDGTRIDRLVLGPTAVAVHLGSPSGEELRLSVETVPEPAVPARPVPPPRRATAVHDPANDPEPPPVPPAQHPPPPPAAPARPQRPPARPPRDALPTPAPGAAWWDSEVAAQPATALVPSPGVASAGSITVGRGEGNDIVVEDPEVSRQHARIDVPAPGAPAVVHDLGSFNGTFVNGSRLQGPIELAVGAELTVGSHTLRWDGSRLVPSG